ncbi:glucosaminidase domain-containing protein [Actinokineospora globicatena]|uniref:Glucosaminidase n=1 Tax=Actinokineospora globicatena TaxID=103729 RepID=A0A9W6QNW4_9PSEU|nr:glucosaminidase domain-containing protein [Actinokineospora globicatena]MCP2301136.1 flagellar protein FlgJ [Actinokineospora globicatena]GLW77228.1 glucosaminidase [Actinokineospora globicatena]GLW84062.1 glucosaminidase [Actinokineospora globicatena]GLW91994.1 glucosaminidase [Actinokineospora globicatena]
MGNRQRIAAAVLAVTALVLGPAQATADPLVRQVRGSAAAKALARVQYLDRAAPLARAVAAEYGIPASVTAGQSILESSWGQSRLAVNDLNYFGFKCTSAGPGPFAVGCHDYPTTECTPDCHQVQALFRVYDSMQASFRDYGRVLSTSKNYIAALPLAHDPNAYVTEVARKYATDPLYAGKVIRIMQENDLYRLDAPLP